MINGLITIVTTGIGLAGVGGVFCLRLRARSLCSEPRRAVKPARFFKSPCGQGARPGTRVRRPSASEGESFQANPHRSGRPGNQQRPQRSLSAQVGHPEFCGGRQLAKVSRDRLTSFSASGTSTCLSLSAKGAQAPCDFNAVILSLSLQPPQQYN